MAKRTVDFGIDLGTTNSAVAHITPKGPSIIPVRNQNYIASAVAKSRSGDLKVGADALRPDFVPVARRFKRLMGTAEQLDLAGGSKLGPIALSAEILKALKAAVKLRTGQEMENVVITVPAMFNQPQCEATNECAVLAGLNAVALLQEPVAASIAYLSSNPVEGNYLVYDLGGGTFDVSLVRLRDGEMQVLDHGGDNFLGGSDFDDRLTTWVGKQLQKLGVSEERLKGLRDRFLLYQACEAARIELSDQEAANIYLDFLELPVSKIEVTRQNLIDQIEDLVTKTIEFTRDRLLTRGFDGSDIESILLVGGPTQMPYIRDRLREEFGVPLNLDQDPMTVVAEGAALHASTMLAERSDGGLDVVSSNVVLDLHYEPVSPTNEAFVAGKAISPTDFKGEVRVASESGDFDTGWIMLVGGAFTADLVLGKSAMTRFKVSIRDLVGSLQICTPDEITIRSGVRTAQAVAPYNYGVVVKQAGKQNVVKLIVKAGAELPAYGRVDVEIAETLNAGSPDFRTVYFVEGNSEDPNDSLEVARLILRGSEIPRTLKAGEKVEIKLRIDQSRKLKFDVHVPLIDQDWQGESKVQIDYPEPVALAEALSNVRSALGKIEDHVAADEQGAILRATREVERLEALLEDVEGGKIEGAYQVHKQLSDTQTALRPLRNRYELVAHHAEIAGRIESSTSYCQQFSDSMGEAKLKEYSKDLDKALRLQDRSVMDAIREKVMEIFWEHYGKTRECAEYQIHWMKEAAPMASDSLSYYELVRRAEQALHEDDRRGVLLYAEKAWDFLPSRERARNRYHDAGVM